MYSADPLKYLILTAVIIVNVLLIQHFYNRGWYPQESRVFAHAVEPLITPEGTKPGLNDFHPGYLTAINRWALRAFGNDFVSLRYPLMAAVLLGSLLLFQTFYARGPATALLAAFVPSVLGVFQFINPNHHWYTLFLSLLTGCLLSRPPREGTGRRFTAGLLTASIFLFRQLTGVFMAMACLAFFLYEARSIESAHRRRSGWDGIIFLAASIVLIIYFLQATNLTGFILFGLGPLTLLWWERINVQTAPQDVRNILFQFFAGAACGFIPITAVHLFAGDLGPWAYNSFISSMAAFTQPVLGDEDFFKTVYGGAFEMLHAGGWTAFLNGMFWFIVPLLGLINLVMLLRRLQAVPAIPAHKLAIPFFGVFYGLVALHHQVPAYLFFAVSFPLLGILWMEGRNHGHKRAIAGAGTMLLLCIGLYFHAGQPLNRQYIKGERVQLAYAGATIPRLSLWIDPADLRIYSETIALVQANTQPKDPIFVLPNDAELYFLADRKNLFRFLSTDEGIRDAAGAVAVANRLVQAPPPVIIDRPDDKRHTAWSRDLLRAVTQHYTLLKTVGPFDIYQFRGR